MQSELLPEGTTVAFFSISYLVLLWIYSSPKKGCFPAVHIFLRITGQFYLTEIFINVPRHMNQSQTDTFVSYLNASSSKHLHFKRNNKCNNELKPDLCSVLKMAKMCFVDIKPFSTSLIFRLSRGNMYFFSFS